MLPCRLKLAQPPTYRPPKSTEVKVKVVPAGQERYIGVLKSAPMHWPIGINAIPWHGVATLLQAAAGASLHAVRMHRNARASCKARCCCRTQQGW